MRFIRIVIAFILAVATAFTLASIFYTQQVLAKQVAIGAEYTAAQQHQTYIENFIGLAPAYGAILAVALLIGFTIATFLKRILAPLAVIAYPMAGAAAVFAVIFLIENIVAADGAGAIGGARDALGLALQCLAGAIGGLVFALTVGRGFSAR